MKLGYLEILVLFNWIRGLNDVPIEMQQRPPAATQ